MTATDPGPARLRALDLSLGYGDRTVVPGLSLDVPDGRVTVVVGANACGKSTFLRGLARLLAPRGGAVLLDGADIARTPSREVARVLGMLPQSPVAPEGITVRDLVSRGRHPHQSWWRQWGGEDAAAVEDALRATGTLELAERDVDELSGGQRQRVWIAMAVAQRTDLLLLDEPTTYLDMAHQLDVLELVAALNRDRGSTVVMVLHDLNLACRYAHHIVAMRAGEVVAQGEPAQVVTEELLREVFSVEASVLTDPRTGAPVIVPHRTVAT
ncbi:ABC transporter ATP-binding protein [Nocardiopsis sp. CC223A]|uniref:ABC transporter ATP-binding protein n=1 Tax=Nocardiopsis sp. CC223A TaxID=3044051 RepID=UPI00278BE66D|nr:ABC transporter ATP-binding protein [Nocardiopsis sp. CC223A]